MRNNRRFDNEIAAVAVPLLREQYRDEIERAIDRAKHPLTAQDRWFRREWHRAGAKQKRYWTTEHGGRQDEWPAAQWKEARAERSTHHQHTSGE